MDKQRIISIAGRISSGKDTLAEYLVTQRGFKKLSFAGSLKDSVATVFNWDRGLLEGTTQESREWREQVDPWWAKRLALPDLTPRWVLQYIGTEVFRQHFHQDIWTASLENKLVTCKDSIVITDARFQNELDTVKRVGGTTIRVHRGEEPDWYSDAVIVNTDPANAEWSNASARLAQLNIHPSEWSSVGLYYDHHIYNDGTITELQQQMASILSQE